MTVDLLGDQSLYVIYKDVCPLCGGGENLLADLLNGLACKSHQERYISPAPIDQIFAPFNFSPWGAQRLWARRFIRRESFAMISPTGSGKTVTGLAFAIYASLQHKKTIIIAPNSTLAFQLQEKLQQVAKNLSQPVKIASYHSLSGKATQEELLNADIIVTTSQSISLNKKLFGKIKADIIIAEDAYTLLKNSATCQMIISKMLGVSKKDIKKAEKLINLKRRLKKENHFDKIAQLQQEVLLRDKQVIITGATRPPRRTRQVKILSELLGFDIRLQVAGSRNILDVYLESEEGMFQALLHIIKKLGRGGIIYVHGAQNAEEIAERLVQEGINARAYTHASRKVFVEFASGKIDLLVGTSNIRSSLVRGIDLPEIVRYVVFFGVPKIPIIIDRDNFTPGKMFLVLYYISRYLQQEDRNRCWQIMDKLRRVRDSLSDRGLKKIKSNQIDHEFLEFARDVMEQSLQFYSQVIQNNRIPGVTPGGLVFPDAQTYIQASGRTSRLTVGGMTRGLSIVLVDDKHAFELLSQQLEPVDIEFAPLSQIDVDKVIQEIDQTRRLKLGVDIEFKSTLLVVESPTKARTIARFFGKPLKRTIEGLPTYEVMSPGRLLIVVATRGHFFRLDIFHEKGFGAVYEDKKLVIRFIPTRPEVIRVLSKLAMDVDEVFVATDPDAEGEKIAWDIRGVISPFNHRTKRIFYHEVTKRAIENALSNPQEFNTNLFHSQLLRTVEDAWIGLPLSIAVQEEFSKHWLSAGRVQSAVLGWIKHRSEQNKAKRIELLKMELENGFKLTVRAPPGTYQKVKENGYVEIAEVKEDVEERNPWPPYTTDSFLVDATRGLRISTEEAMQLVQDLFESGLITYHRTDSTQVSAVGMSIAKKYLAKINQQDKIHSRPWGEGHGAHECIRPTKPSDDVEITDMIRNNVIFFPKTYTKKHRQLYALIFKRFIASQMTPARVKVASVIFDVGGQRHEVSMVREILEAGFTEVSPLNLIDIDLSKRRFSIKRDQQGELLLEKKITGERPLYLESDVIKMMKDNKIGRPSTYAATISKLKDRYYVFRVPTGHLTSTSLGNKVYTFLASSYSNLINEQRTARVLEKMDMIEQGQAKLIDVVGELYDELCKELGSYGEYLYKSK